MFAKIGIFTNSVDDKALDYIVPDFLKDDIKKGYIVDIPFGKQIKQGIVIDLYDNYTGDYELKPIVNISLDIQILNDTHIKTIDFIANYYICMYHKSLGLFINQAILKYINSKKFLTEISVKRNYNYAIKLTTLTTEQSLAYTQIKDNISNKVLLYGITGSGKTSIIAKLVRDNLAMGKQSLILIPEILLSSQIYNDFVKFFGEDVILINSSISQSAKNKAFVDILTNKAKIIIGTRSALFFPYQDLGLVVVDEFHDNSYINSDTPNYDIVEVLLATVSSDTKVVLSSGTPSIKYMYKAVKKEIGLVNLLTSYTK